MKRTFVLIGFLVIGLIASQLGPGLIGDYPDWLNTFRQFLTMSLLAYIMIEVGREFEIDLKNKKKYGLDYLVAATAATFPWIFVSLYFYFFLMPDQSSTNIPLWIEALLGGRFAAPTSAGVLFSLLAAAGLSKTWAFKKTRILAIFDDLDTVILMIPLQLLIVGLAWQLGGILFAVVIFLFLGVRYYRKIKWPVTWQWVMLYSFIITAVSEIIYHFSKDPQTHVGLHIEVLLPAFVLGCMLKNPRHSEATIPGEDEPGLESEEVVGLIVSSVFLFLVGFSMPSLFSVSAGDSLSVGWLIFHVIVVTVLSNLGKMFAIFFYKDEATLRERLAVSISMFPRGEVGAGVLATALGYGMAGHFITVAFLSLALNLLLTGVFIYLVKLLLNQPVRPKSRRTKAPA